MRNASAQLDPNDLWSARPWAKQWAQDICPSADSDGIIRSISSLIHCEQMGYGQKNEIKMCIFYKLKRLHKLHGLECPVWEKKHCRFFLMGSGAPE